MLEVIKDSCTTLIDHASTRVYHVKDKAVLLILLMPKES